MVKVLIITSMGNPPYVGGIENVVDTIVVSSLSEMYSITLFDTYRRPDQERKIYHKLIYAIYLFFLCAKHILKIKPQIVHIHFCSGVDFWKHSICLVTAKLFCRKSVFHLHGGSFDRVYNGYHPAKQYLVRLVFKFADIVIALSGYWQNLLLNITPLKKIQIIPNPINCREIALHTKQNSEVNTDSILLLGSLGKRKGHYDVLKALPVVLKKHPNIQVYFGGLDEDLNATETLKKIAVKTNVIDNVTFLGAITGDPKLVLLGQSKIVILPSYAENMPISVLEGMAAGKPVISTKVGAIPEVLDNGECGILIDPGDWQALADNIIYLMDNPGYAGKIGRQAQQKAFTNWDINKIIVHIDTIYKKLISNPKVKIR